MTKPTLVLFGCTIAALVAACLFPQWTISQTSPAGAVQSLPAGMHWIGSGPVTQLNASASVDWLRTLLGLGAILAVAFVINLILGVVFDKAAERQLTKTLSATQK